MTHEDKTLATKGPDKLATSGRPTSGGYFEYKVVKVSDLMDGGANVGKIEELLNLYGEMGWRLSQTVVNEIGRAPYINEDEVHQVSTQEETLLILERWVPVN